MRLRHGEMCFSPNGTACGSHGREPMVTGQTPASEAPTGRHESSLLSSLRDFALMGGPRSMGSRPWLHRVIPLGLRGQGFWVLRNAGSVARSTTTMRDLWPDPLRQCRICGQIHYDTAGSVARSNTTMQGSVARSTTMLFSGF